MLIVAKSTIKTCSQRSGDTTYLGTSISAGPGVFQRDAAPYQPPPGWEAIRFHYPRPYDLHSKINRLIMQVRSQPNLQMLVAGTGTEFGTTSGDPGQSSFRALALQLLSLFLCLLSLPAVAVVVSVVEGHADGPP